VRSRQQRPPVVTGGVDAVAVTLPIAIDPTAPSLPLQEPEATASIPIRDKIRWIPRNLEAVVGMSWRWMLREISAGRMPPPDLRLGRSVGYRPATIRSWLDSRAPRRGGPKS
jgi:predicted DNA-binding transcriptional regulator AlpA